MRILDLGGGERGVSLGALGDLLEGLTDGVVVLDRRRRVKAFNSAFARMFRLEPGTIAIGDRLETLLRAIGTRGGLEIGVPVEEAVERRLARWGTPDDRRERRTLADGRIIDVLRSATEDGDMVSVHADVTAELRRERELELQRVYMASILDNITDGVALVDASAHYIAFNRRFLELFDIDPARVHWGMNIDALYDEFGDLKELPEAERVRAKAERKRFIADPDRHHVERHLANGRVLDITKALLPTGGSVLTIRDKTEDLRRTATLRLAQETAERSSLHKSQFLARMSHEMRTPLNGVLGIVALLLKTDLDPRQRDYAAVIHRSGAMLIRLIDDVLDLSRIEAGRVELREAPFNPLDVLHDCIALVAPLARAKGLEMVEAPCPEPVPQMIGDGVRLQQVMLNLLGNAVKFTPEGAVTAGLRVARRGDLCDCRLFVRDTGIGIAEEEHEAVFEQFYQIDGSHRRASGGAGLGLTISRRLVEAMGGRIALGSERGRGSVFEVFLTLPLAEAAPR